MNFDDYVMKRHNRKRDVLPMDNYSHNKNAKDMSYVGDPQNY